MPRVWRTQAGHHAYQHTTPRIVRRQDAQAFLRMVMSKVPLFRRGAESPLPRSLTGHQQREVQVLFLVAVRETQKVFTMHDVFSLGGGVVHGHVSVVIETCGQGLTEVKY